MPVYSKKLGCWISNTLIPAYDPYPDADPNYDADSDEIDYGTDEDSEDEDVHYIVRPGFPKQKTANRKVPPPPYRFFDLARPGPRPGIGPGPRPGLW